MNRIRIDELNGKTRFIGVQINTHEYNEDFKRNTNGRSI